MCNGINIYNIIIITHSQIQLSPQKRFYSIWAANILRISDGAGQGPNFRLGIFNKKVTQAQSDLIFEKPVP
jgi:hypothetical protein